MKFTLAALALAATAYAQSSAIDSIPACARTCLEDAITKNTSCSLTDLACVCKNFSTVSADSTSCVIKACGDAEAINKVLPAAQALCSSSSTSAVASSTSAVSSSAVVSTSSSSVMTSQTMTSMTSMTAVTTQPMVTETVPCTTAVNTTTSAPIATAGAAGMGSIGAVAIAALGALAL